MAASVAVSRAAVELSLPDVAVASAWVEADDAATSAYVAVASAWVESDDAGLPAAFVAVSAAWVESDDGSNLKAWIDGDWTGLQVAVWRDGQWHYSLGAP